MLRTVKGIFQRQSQETLIKQYTQDLATITSKIHQLDQLLKRKDATKARWHRRCNLHGTSALALVNAIFYVQLEDKHFILISIIVSIVMFILLKWTLNRWFEFSTQRTVSRLTRLRAQHQEKLEALKQKTHFYSTNSLIQRFSSGEHQAEDAMTLMDEEMKTKYEELGALQKELESFQKHENTEDSQAQREKWFDKVLDVISGGDLKLESQVKPTVCGSCGKHTGSYSIAGTRLQYVCPLCGWRYDSDEKKKLETVGQEPSKKVT